jgi:hypothetical protein
MPAKEHEVEKVTGALVGMLGPSNIFIVDKFSNEFKHSELDIDLSSIELDLPFHNIFIESRPENQLFWSEEYIISGLNLLYSSTTDEYYYMIVSPGKVIEDIDIPLGRSSTDYIDYIPRCFVGTFKISEIAKELKRTTDYGNHPAFASYVLAKKFCESLDHSSFAKEVVSKGVKVPKKNNPKKSKTQYVEKEVIYISSDQNQKYFKSPLSGRTVEWKVKFKRRGTWRKISPNSLGKNHKGERVVWGKTWVKDSIVNEDTLLPDKSQLRVFR